MTRLLSALLLLLLSAAPGWGANCGGVTACSCGDTLTSSWTMTGDLSCSNAGYALTLGANDVTLDCDGHSITGDGANVTRIVGSSVQRTGITITNCTLSGSTQYAVGRLISGSITDNTITAGGSGYPAISITTNPASISVTGNTFPQGNGQVFNSTSAGSIVFNDNTITGAAGKSQAYAVRFDGASTIEFKRNTITGWTGTTDGNVVFANGTNSFTSEDNVLGSQAAPNNGRGFWIAGSGAGTCTIASNNDVVSYQGQYGFHVDSCTGAIANGAVSYTSGAASVAFGYSIGSIDGTETLAATITGTDLVAHHNEGHGFQNAPGSTATFTRIISYSNGDADAGANNVHGLIQGGTTTCNDCTFYDNWNNGTLAGDPNTSLTCNRCTSYDNGDRKATAGTGMGFACANDAECTINYSLAYGNFSYGYGAANTSTSILRNTTLAGNGPYGIYYNSSGNISVTNTISQGSTTSFATGASAAGTITSDYNVFQATNAAQQFTWLDTTTYKTFAEWQALTSGDSHSYYADPLFRAVDDFHLRPGSPAIDAGTDLCATLTDATDYAGTSVCTGGVFSGRGSAPDIGAYESIPYPQIHYYGH